METPNPDRGTRLRAILFGVLAGALFAAMRAPNGLSWTEVPCPRGWTSAVFGAAPWLALALLLHPSRRAFARGFSVPLLSISSIVGFLFWSAWVTTRFRPESRFGFAALFVLGTAALWAAAGRRTSSEGTGSRDPFLARAGLVFSAAGAVLALENLTHHVRLFSLGLPEDDALIATVLLLLISLGALSFGGLAARPGWERPLLGVGLVAAAAATPIGLAFLQKMDVDELFSYLHRFGRDISSVGMLPTTALLAAASLVVPGLLCGSALRGVSDAARLSSVALGASLGMLVHPFAPALLGGGPRPPGEAFWSWNVALAGTAVACLGALTFVAGAERGRIRIVSCVLVLLLPALSALRPRQAFTSFSPWYPAPIDPVIIVPTPVGILTVEPYVDGSRLVTLDRKRLTPLRTEVRVDELRFLRALGAAPTVEGRSLRLLVVGQLTPERSSFLSLLGPLEVDRTAPWFSAFPAIEDVLFPVDEPPIGTAIPPAEAEERITSGRYDLVLVLPVHGPLLTPKSQALIPWGSVEEPALGSLEVPEGTAGIAWLDANSPLVRCELGERILYVADRFLRPTLGVVRGTIREDPAAEKPAVFAGGEPEPRLETWELLSILPRERNFLLHAANFRRLEHANASGPAADLARGLSIHYGAQRVSSPFESLPQQIEFEEDELRAFYTAGGLPLKHDEDEAPELDATTRDVWEDAAWLLTEKREPHLVLAYVGSLADAHRPWIALDRATARAFEELLEPAQALRYYDRIFESTSRTGSYDLNEMLRASDVALEAGDPARAAGYAKKGLEIQPRQDFEMRLCRALLLNGDPDGNALLERLRPNLTAEEMAWVEGTTGPELPAPEDMTEDPAALQGQGTEESGEGPEDLGG